MNIGSVTLNHLEMLEHIWIIGIMGVGKNGVAVMLIVVDCDVVFTIGTNGSNHIIHCTLVYIQLHRYTSNNI